MKSKLVEMSFHIRHKNKKIKEITNQTRREARSETNPTKSHKANLKLLMSVLNTMPVDQQADFSNIKSLVDDESPVTKENTPNSFKQIFRSTTSEFAKDMRITEIPYKNYVENDEYLYNIYISDAQTANDLVELQKYNIFALLTFGQSNDPFKYTFLKGGYLCLPLEDASKDLMKMMQRVMAFITTHLEKGNILIHCCHGNSRSCAAVIGFLIKKYRMTFDTALEVVRAGRPSMKLAYAFERQLKRIERAELYN